MIYNTNYPTMKTKLILFITLLTACWACSDSDKHHTPFGDIELPSVNKPWQQGEEVTITGRGFTQGCEIWFKAINIYKKVKALNTVVTPTAISFTNPEVFGEQELILKVNGKDYVLAEVNFAETIISTVVDKIVYASRDEFEYITTFNYDKSGNITEVKEAYGSAIGRTTYQYTSDSIYREYYAAGQTVPDKATFKLNEKGVIARADILKQPAVSVSYTYNDKNKVTAIKEGTKEYLITWNGSNNIEAITTGQWSDEFSYTTTRLSGANIDLNFLITDFAPFQDQWLAGKGYFGTRIRNLVKEYKHLSSDPYTYTYEYLSDERGNIINMNIRGANNTVEAAYTITYTTIEISE